MRVPIEVVKALIEAEGLCRRQSNNPKANRFFGGYLPIDLSIMEPLYSLVIGLSIIGLTVIGPLT
jgi:hypothetical protein